MSDRIDDLERKARAATPGPWVADHSEEDNSAVKQEGRSWWDGLAFCGRPADAKFIAAANPATILRLIEQNRRIWQVAQSDRETVQDFADEVAATHAVRDAVAQDLARMAARLAAVEALADEVEQAGDPLLRLDRLRAALAAAPTDTTKEN